MKTAGWLILGAVALLAAVPSCTTTRKKAASATSTPTPTATSTPTPTFARLHYTGAVFRGSAGFITIAGFTGTVADTSPTPGAIANATVLVNGTPASWNAANSAYQITPLAGVSAGTVMTVTYFVPPGGGVWGYEPGTGTVTMPNQPGWVAPSTGATLSVSAPMTWTWTYSSGTPDYFGLFSLGYDNPTPVAGGLPTAVPGTQLTYNVPANAMVVGAGTPTPAMAILVVGAVEEALIQGSYEAAQMTPTPSLIGTNGAGNIVYLNP